MTLCFYELQYIMKQIPIYGQVNRKRNIIVAYALIDDEDFDKVNNYRWCLNKRYARSTFTNINGERKNISMHQLIMNFPILDVDHKDRNTLNNQKNNLREATDSQNIANSLKCKSMNGYITTSKYKGVCWHKVSKKWISQIHFNNKNKYLGLFYNEADAAIAYNNKAKELFKEFAVLNKI